MFLIEQTQKQSDKSIFLRFHVTFRLCPEESVSSCGIT